MQKKTNGENSTKFTEAQLRDALMHAEDVLDRALLSLEMLVLGETAKAMKDEAPLSGDGIDIGIEERYMNESTIGVLESIRDSEHMLPYDIRFDDPRGFSWEYNGVPIRVKFIHRKYPWFTYPQEAFYFTGNYRIPNPFEKYYKARFLVR